MTRRRSTRTRAAGERREPPVLSGDRVIPAALAAGVLRPDDVVHRTVEVHSIGRSHPVFRVSVDGRPTVVLKGFGPRRGDTDGELAREAAVIALAKRQSALAALLPAPLRWRGPEAVIATAFAEGATAASLDGLGGGSLPGTRLDWSTLVGAVAAPLARLHRATESLATPDPALLAPMPWGLRLFDGDASPDLWASPPFVRVLVPLGGDGAVPAGVRRARGAWRVRCLIHGDLKHENILVRDEGGRAAITIVDWEMARMGDPAWDLAALFVRLLLAEAPSSQSWSDSTVDAAALMLAGYARAAKLPVAALAQRLVLYSGVWLLMTSIQFVSTLSGAEPGDGQLAPMLASARTTLLDADRLTGRVIAAVEDALR